MSDRTERLAASIRKAAGSHNDPNLPVITVVLSMRAEIERLRTARNLAYGLLWTTKSDNEAVHRARRVLRDTMHREDQVAGIVAARAALSGGEHE